MSIGDYPNIPAAFINAIYEEGSKAEAIEFLQQEWNENCALKAQIVKLTSETALLRAEVDTMNNAHRAMAIQMADLGRAKAILTAQLEACHMADYFSQGRLFNQEAEIKKLLASVEASDAALSRTHAKLHALIDAADKLYAFVEDRALTDDDCESLKAYDKLLDAVDGDYY